VGHVNKCPPADGGEMDENLQKSYGNLSKKEIQAASHRTYRTKEYNYE
jgi:uncharacterized protein (DUF433 family)